MYVVGDAVPQGHVIYQNMVVPVSIYNALQLGANPLVAVQPEPQQYCNFKLPIFAGKEDNNLQNWLKNAFNKLRLYNIPKRHWVRESANFLEGLALVWFNNWMNTTNNFSWDNFQNGMNTRFGCQHSCLSVARMWDNLKHNNSVDKYIKAHDKIRTLASNEVDANHSLVCHLFLRNLKPGVARFIRNEDCATIEDAYREARNAKQKMKLTSKNYNNNNNNNYKNNNNNKRKTFRTPYEKPSSSNSNNSYNGKGKGDSSKGVRLNQVSNSFSSFSPTHSDNKTRVSKSSSSKSKSSKDTLLYYPFIF